MTRPTRPSTSSSDSASTISLKTPRIAKFGEATQVVSPVDTRRKHFSFNSFRPQPQPADETSGATVERSHVEMEEDKRLPSGAAPLSPAPFSPALKSALKTPGASKAIFSPTFKEEQDLEKAELNTDKEQAKDLKIKTRVRVAKFLLRGTSFACSLIVLAMLTTVFNIFRATQHLPPRFVGSTQMKPWAPNQQTWPQITVLCIACVSLVISLIVFWQYFRGGHQRVEKAAIYYTAFAVGAFGFSIVMWIIGTVVLQRSKSQGGGQDMWGWSCNNNLRSSIYEAEVNYSLVCRLQNWSLVCCIIEVIVDTITIAVYGIVFYRYWTKRKLRKSMGNRDRARSDLYLAQLRSQSAPPTPAWALDRKDETAPQVTTRPVVVVDDDEKTQYVNAQPATAAAAAVAHPRPFVLQPAPARLAGAGTTSPQIRQQTGFTLVQSTFRSNNNNTNSSSNNRPPSPPQQQQQQQQQQQTRSANASPASTVTVAAAPGEQVYEAVPIPDAYAGSPMQAQFSGHR